MVVIVILGLLMGIVVPNVFRTNEVATQDAARMQMHAIGAAMDLYTLENKALPKSLDELTQPTARSREPYLKRIPRDPWNEAYAYRVLDPMTRAYEITSAGTDRSLGTEDDLVFPEREAK
jgi:general secretion pathway protein G